MDSRLEEPATVGRRSGRGAPTMQAKLGTRQGEFCVVPRAPSVTKDTFLGLGRVGGLDGP